MDFDDVQYLFDAIDRLTSQEITPDDDDDPSWNPIFGKNYKEKYGAYMKLRKFRYQTEEWILSIKEDVSTFRLLLNKVWDAAGDLKQNQNAKLGFANKLKMATTKLMNNKYLIDALILSKIMARKTPQEIAESLKLETREKLNQVVGKLNTQVESLETELAVAMDQNLPVWVQDLETSIARIQSHITKLNLILTHLNADTLNPKLVLNVLDHFDGDYLMDKQVAFNRWGVAADNDPYVDLPADLGLNR